MTRSFAEANGLYTSCSITGDDWAHTHGIWELSQAPVVVGWLGRPSACELTVTAALKANVNEPPAFTFSACWTLMGLRPGACSAKLLPESPAPGPAFVIHDVRGGLEDGELSFHAHLQRGSAPDRPSRITATTACGDPRPNAIDLRPFVVAPGESVAFTVATRLASTPSQCTLLVRVQTDTVGVGRFGPALDVGQWCISASDVVAGACA